MGKGFYFLSDEKCTHCERYTRGNVIKQKWNSIIICYYCMRRVHYDDSELSGRERREWNEGQRMGSGRRKKKTERTMVNGFSLPVLVLLPQLFYFVACFFILLLLLLSPAPLSRFFSFGFMFPITVYLTMCARVARYFSAFCRSQQIRFPRLLLFARQYSCRRVYDLYKICAILGYSQYTRCGQRERKKAFHSNPCRALNSLYIFFFVGLHNQSVEGERRKKTTKLR